MELLVQKVEVGWLGEGRPTKQFREASKIGLQEAVKYWHREYLKKHFRPRSDVEYPGQVAKRARPTVIKKAKRFGHTNILDNYPVGSARNLSRISKQSIRVSGTSRRARGIMRGKARMQEGYKREIVAVSNQEHQALWEVVMTALSSKLNDDRYIRRTRL